MKFARLNYASGDTPVDVNLEQVTYIRPSTSANTSTAIFFVGGKSVVVKGSLEAVMTAMMNANGQPPPG